MSKKFTWCCVALLSSLLISQGAMAQDTRYLLSLDDAFSAYQNSKYHSEDVPMYFGDAPHPEIKQLIKTDVVTKRTSQKGRKTYETGSGLPTVWGHGGAKVGAEELKRRLKMCHRIFVSLVAVMKERARRIGADGIVNVESYFKNVPFRSSTEYECWEGSFHGAITLKGDFVAFK